MRLALGTSVLRVSMVLCASSACFPPCDAPELFPNSLVTLWCRSARIFLPPSPWAWIDPGVFALFGAGAFMGGTTRLTIALAVIMMEVGGQTVPQADLRLVHQQLRRWTCALF